MHPRSLRRVLQPTKKCVVRKSKYRHKQSPNISNHAKTRPQTRSQSKNSPDIRGRPYRKAASSNRYTFRYLQTGNPSRLEENDLKRALRASLEDSGQRVRNKQQQQRQPRIREPEDCKMTSVLTTPSGVATRSATRSLLGPTQRDMRSAARNIRHVASSRPIKFQRSILCNDLVQHGQNQYDCVGGSDCMSNNGSNNGSNIGSNEQLNNPSINQTMSYQTYRRYRPVAKKHIYQEADFFHEGIMEYIEYALLIAQRT